MQQVFVKKKVLKILLKTSKRRPVFNMSTHKMKMYLWIIYWKNRNYTWSCYYHCQFKIVRLIYDPIFVDIRWFLKRHQDVKFPNIVLSFKEFFSFLKSNIHTKWMYVYYFFWQLKLKLDNDCSILNISLLLGHIPISGKHRWLFKRAPSDIIWICTIFNFKMIN